VDYPPEECVDYTASMKKHGIDAIFLLAPTSTEERIKQVANIASGYVYYVSLKGVTGINTIDLSDVNTMLAKIKQHVKTPIAVGFGIRDGATAKVIAGVSDAVVIGSRIIQEVESHESELDNEKLISSVHEFINDIRHTMDQ